MILSRITTNELTRYYYFVVTIQIPWIYRELRTLRHSVQFTEVINKAIDIYKPLINAKANIYIFDVTKRNYLNK